MISGLMDIILVIGAWKKIKWMIYLWIVSSYSQSVLICAFFAQLYWPVAICLVYMAIMDNGWSDKGKNSPNLESVGFLGHVCRLPRQNPFMLKKM